MGDRDGKSQPSSEGRGRRSDLHRQAMKRSFGFKSDQPEEAPEEPVFLARTRFPSGRRRRDRGLVQEGPQKREEPVFGLGSTSGSDA